MPLNHCEFVELRVAGRFVSDSHLDNARRGRDRTSLGLCASNPVDPEKLGDRCDFACASLLTRGLRSGGPHVTSDRACAH